MNARQDDKIVDDAEISRRYIEAHFFRAEELADAAALTVEQMRDLISAGCAPGPVYTIGERGIWSALERQASSQRSGTPYYSPGAAWGLRRALLATRVGARPAEAAQMLKRDFQDAFVDALQKFEGSRLAYPACFAGDLVDCAAAREIASQEWSDWLHGGFAICLRIFNGWNCVAKESLRASLKQSLQTRDYDAAQLLLQAETLASLLLPFAPYQRAGGTPGLIDRLLSEEDLGRERPYARL